MGIPQTQVTKRSLLYMVGLHASRGQQQAFIAFINVF